MGGCMSKLKPQGPSLNVYFKIAICRNSYQTLHMPFSSFMLLFGTSYSHRQSDYTQSIMKFRQI